MLHFIFCFDWFDEEMVAVDRDDSRQSAANGHMGEWVVQTVNVSFEKAVGELFVNRILSLFIVLSVFDDGRLGMEQSLS